MIESELTGEGIQAEACNRCLVHVEILVDGTRDSGHEMVKGESMQGWSWQCCGGLIQWDLKVWGKVKGLTLKL